MNTPLYNLLSLIENKIADICLLKLVSPLNLKANLDLFTETELDSLIILLKEKQILQKHLYELQGGDLSNVRFINSYR